MNSICGNNFPGHWLPYVINKTMKSVAWSESVPLDCTPSGDSDQTAHSRSLTRIFARRILDSKGCKDFFHADNDA